MVARGLARPLLASGSVRHLHVLAAIALAGPLSPAGADDCEPITVWRDGHAVGGLCRGDAGEHELAALDLSDDWVPPVFAASEDGGPGYRQTYLALAQERFADAGEDAALAPADRYFELFGIPPSLGVVRARLADEARHRCHAAIDDAPLAAAPDRIVEETGAQAVARIASARGLHAELEHDRVRRKLADLEALAAVDAYYRRAVDRLTALEAYLAAVRTIQAHLGCDGLFASPPADAAYTWQTSDAVARFQRGAMILPTGIADRPTRDALALGSRERDFRTALRALRERVVAATGLIEDGTAGTGPGTVLGRDLEPEATWRVRGHEPLDGAAPDLISAATEAAARALGWQDADTAQASLEALAASPSRVVGVPLPAAPPYHRAGMTLEVEIDRGDVWPDRALRWHDGPRRPALILYTRERSELGGTDPAGSADGAGDEGARGIAGDRRIPLVRWPTTIGGWQWQNVDGDIAERWKESPVGPRVWSNLFVGPRWLPPESTPDRELVRGSDAHAVLAREQLGPSYRAAFGLIAFVHLVAEQERGQVVLEDQGIRTHGTGNLTSLVSGVSHGCHRLLGRNVVRLADFMLAHHDHIRHGEAPTYYRRIVRHGGNFPIAIDSLGYRIELIPPIPVDVLPGRVHR